jgi:DNA polymerase III epsilon subunit-like protein
MTKKNIAVIDTETASLCGEVFDIGVVICDKKGEILAKYEALNADVFNNLATMKKAFYFGKVDTFYRPNLRCGRMTLKPWKLICKELNELFKMYDVGTVAAYNLAFDRRVIIETGKKYGGFLAINNMQLLDLWRVSCETLLQQKTYKKLAVKMGWVSPAGNIKTSAEVAYRYGMGAWEFEESHTALDDALIETELLKKLFKLKKKINYGIVAHPWRLVNKKEA